MLRKAKKWTLIFQVPKFRLATVWDRGPQGCSDDDAVSHPELEIVRDALNATQFHDDPVLFVDVPRHTTILCANQEPANLLILGLFSRGLGLSAFDGVSKATPSGSGSRNPEPQAKDLLHKNV
jgi:hypothetical protein